MFYYFTHLIGMRRGRVFGLAEGEEPLQVGERCLVAGQRKGHVRYSGNTDFAPGRFIIAQLR